MAILLSNDDGITAFGLQALSDAVATLDEIWIVAPDRNQSAVSHALTLQRPLRIEQVGERRYAVDGTPTDCVNLAINGILPQRPRLLISGINHGANLGDDVTYSGTVSAAMEATLLGVPAIAISQLGSEPFDFGTAVQFVHQLAATVLRDGIPADTLLNVNVPDGAASRIKGFQLTRQGKRRYSDAVVENVDPRGKKYYWIGGGEADFVAAEGTDFSAIHSGRISVTPLHLDLTNYVSLQSLQSIQIRFP
ncbi:MAG: 5'/3'-nucleotidase SurE [Deltaproteobacteria bacterium]|nr:5'/3'-nucleotidase SurE [Deltaproteobacteria bacterium]